MDEEDKILVQMKSDLGDLLHTQWRVDMNKILDLGKVNKNGSFTIGKEEFDKLKLKLKNNFDEISEFDRYNYDYFVHQILAVQKDILL